LTFAIGAAWPAHCEDSPGSSTISSGRVGDRLYDVVTKAGGPLDLATQFRPRIEAEYMGCRTKLDPGVTLGAAELAKLSDSPSTQQLQGVTVIGFHPTVRISRFACLYIRATSLG
jgi:hypothetical protein